MHYEISHLVHKSLRTRSGVIPSYASSHLMHYHLLHYHLLYCRMQMWYVYCRPRDIKLTVCGAAFSPASPSLAQSFFNSPDKYPLHRSGWMWYDVSCIHDQELEYYYDDGDWCVLIHASNVIILISRSQSSHINRRGETIVCRRTRQISWCRDWWHFISCLCLAFLGCHGNQLVSCVPCSWQLYHRCLLQAHSTRCRVVTAMQ